MTNEQSTGYECPIMFQYMDDLHTEIVRDQENFVVKAVCNMGIQINKDELVKALEYDRDQYLKGYEDAKKEFDSIDAEIKKYKDLSVHYIALSDTCGCNSKYKYDYMASACTAICTNLRKLQTWQKLEEGKADEVQS